MTLYVATNVPSAVAATVLAAGSAISLTTATSANVVSASLAAGTYLIWGSVDFALAGTTETLAQAGISLTSATLPSQAGGSGLGTEPLTIVPLITTTVTATHSVKVGPTTLTLTVTTTVYLVAQATFSAGTEAASGTLFVMPLRQP